MTTIEPSLERWDLPSSMTTTFDFDYTNGRDQLLRLYDKGTRKQWVGSDRLDWSLEIEGGSLAMLRYVLDARLQARAPDVAAVDAQLQELLRGWTDLRAVLAVETVRGINGTDKVEAQIRYLLTSCGDDPAVLVRAIRRHWSVENALHWVLDVTFREDDSRVRDRTAARNLALLRKIALNLAARDRDSRASLRGRRKRAAWDDDYMLQLIAGQAHA